MTDSRIKFSAATVRSGDEPLLVLGAHLLSPALPLLPARCGPASSSLAPRAVKIRRSQVTDDFAVGMPSEEDAALDADPTCCSTSEICDGLIGSGAFGTVDIHRRRVLAEMKLFARLLLLSSSSHAPLPTGTAATRNADAEYRNQLIANLRGSPGLLDPPPPWTLPSEPSPGVSSYYPTAPLASDRLAPWLRTSRHIAESRPTAPPTLFDLELYTRLFLEAHSEFATTETRLPDDFFGVRTGSLARALRPVRRQDRHDVLMDSWLHIYSKEDSVVASVARRASLGTCSVPAGLAHHAYWVVKRTAYEHVRRARRSPLAVASFDTSRRVFAPTPLDACDPCLLLLADEQRSKTSLIVSTAMKRLSPRQRQVLSLSYGFGEASPARSTADIANLLHISPSTVRQTLRAAHVRLARTLATPPRSPLHPLYTLANFVVGPSNASAFAAATVDVLDSTASDRLVFIQGGRGVGKTHLLQAVCRTTMDHPHARVSYLTAVDFAKHCLTAITEGTVDHFRTRMLALDLLAVDDVHMLSRFVRMELLYLLRMMRRRRRTVFLAGTSHPSTLVTECEEREAAFASWRVLPLSMPTPATRREIARRKAHGTGCTLSADIIDYLARDIGDLKELNLALEAITERAALEGVPVDLPMVAATVEPMKRGGAAVLGIERITSVVTSILAGDQSACATPRDLRPSLVAYFARELTSLSLAQVGYASGLGIEPVRVLRAINDVHDWIATRSDVRALVASARAALLLPPRLQPSAGESDAHGVNVSSHLRSDGR